MATNSFDDSNGYENPLRSVINAAAILTPIGAGAAVTFSKLKANQPISTDKFGVRNSVLGEIGRQIGGSLRDTYNITKARQKQAADQLLEQLMQDDYLDKLLSKVQTQNAVVQSILTSLEDPNTGIDPAVALGYKEELTKLLSSPEITKEELANSLKGMIVEIFSVNSDARINFESRLREYKKLSPFLEAPVSSAHKIKADTPLVSLENESQLSQKAQARLKKLKEVFGNQFSFRTLEDTTLKDQRATYVEIRSKSRGTFKTLLPLELPEVSETGYRTVRLGASRINYIADQYLIHAPRALEIFESAEEEPTLDLLRRKGAIVSLEDYYVNLAAEYFEEGKFTKEAFRGFNAALAEILVAEPRLAKEDSYIGQHLRNMAKFQSNVARFYNLQDLEKSRRRNLMEKLAESPDFDFGVGPDRLAEQNIENRISFLTSIKSGSAFSAMRTGLEGVPGFKGIDREIEPLTARLEQVVHRLSQGAVFVPHATAKSSGTLAEMLGSNTPVLWSESLTGTTLKAMLLDVGQRSDLATLGVKRGKLWEALSSKGQAYSTGIDKVIKTGVIALYDPTKHGTLSTKILNRLVEAGVGQSIKLTQKELRELGTLVGFGPAGERHIPLDPRMQAIELSLDSLSRVENKSIVRVNYKMHLDMETAKLFSRMFKGTVMETTEEQLIQELTQYEGINAAKLRKYGLESNNLIVGSGEMLKKSPTTMMRQLASGYGYVSRAADWEEQLKKQATSILRGGQETNLDRLLRNLSKFMGKDDVNPLGLMTASVIKLLAENPNISAVDAGLVLGGIWNRAVNTTDSWLKGQRKQYQLDLSTLEQAINVAFGERAAKVKRVASAGLVLGVENAALGEGVGDWFMARASIEPRTLEMLQANLRALNLSLKDTSDILAGLLTRKFGSGKDIKLASELTRLAATASGLGAEVFPAGFPENIPRMTFEEVKAAMAVRGHEKLSKFLAEEEHGIFLDVTSASKANVEGILREASSVAFGGANYIYLPGKAAAEATAHSYIETVSGTKSVDIGSPMGKAIDTFYAKMEDVLSMGATSRLKDVEDIYTSFSQEVLKLSTTALHNLTRGSIKGSASGVAAAYNTATGVFLTDEQRKLIRETFVKTKGMAVWVDDYMFLSQLKDFMGSGTRYEDVVGEKKVFDPAAETVAKLEMFYTGMEQGVGQRKGIVAFGVRNPVLSMGNVPIIQVFRDVRQVGQAGAHDPIFSEIKKRKWGRRALRRFGHKVTSWGDIAKSQNKRARKQFFEDFAENLKSFYGYQGGGRVFIADEYFTVHYGDQQAKVDFGIAGAAFGDFDGDQWGIFMLDKHAGRKIISTLGELDETEFAEINTLYKLKSTIYGEEAKAALERKAKAMGTLSKAEAELQDALKEKASKEATGLVDVHLNELRRSLLVQENLSLKEIAGGQALLKVLEEHTTIKGKKLPIYQPLAERLSHAIDELIRGGNEKIFRTTVRDIFKGSQLLDQGVSISGIDLDIDAPFISQKVVGEELSLDRDIDIIISAAKRTREQFVRYATGGSAKQLAAAIRNAGLDKARTYRDIFMSGASMQAGMLESAMSTGDLLTSKAMAVGSRIMSTLEDLNLKGTGPLVAGFGVAFGASLMLGQSYAPEPLMMPGEVVAPNVRDAIAAGEALQGQGHRDIPAEDLSQRVDPYNMMMRPINQNQTYMTKPTTYQIGINAHSPASYVHAANYISSFPGLGNRSSVMINDTRQPITSNYYDRLTGEY